MKILSRRVVVQKPIEDVKRIIQNSSFIHPNHAFVSNTFSILVRRRFSPSGKTIIPIRGMVLEDDDKAKIILEVHADVSIVISAIMILVGVVLLVWSFVNSTVSEIPAFGAMLIGICAAIHFIGEGKGALDQLEEKLQR